MTPEIQIKLQISMTFSKKKFLSTVIEWNKLDPTFRNTTSP